MTGRVRPHYSSALIALVLGLGSILALLASLGIEVWETDDVPLAYAANEVRYVAPTGLDNSNNCTNSTNPCATIQYAVDVANPDDEIRVSAGTYTGVSARVGITQMVYISKSVTVQGGYTTTNWTTPDPVANPTTLDAQGQGRVLYIIGEIGPTVTGLHITGGDAADLGGTPGGLPTGSGGGIYVISATATISNNYIFNNISLIAGGGLFLWDSNATLRGNTIISNSAGGSGGGAGGGLLLYQSNTTVGENIISLNTTGGSGGGLIAVQSDAMLIGNKVTSNTARYGGGLTLEASNASLSGNLVISNTAYLDPSSGGGYGGGLFLLGSTATLTGNIVTANTAFAGGGLNLTYSEATLVGNTISGNSADGGGGLAAVDGSAALSQNTIAANSAGGNGGGVLLSQYDMSGDITLNGNTIISNTAGEFGGGAALVGTVTMTNNIVADNQSNIAGSGLAIGNYGIDSARLLHTTIARNSGGDGSGIFIGGSAELINTILVSQTVGITVPAGSTAALEATLWGSGSWANGTDWAGSGSIMTGTINIWGDPAFADPEAGDYHLNSASAAIGEAVDVGVTTDIDGESRDFFPDLGADESSYQSLIWPVNGYSIPQSDPLRAHLENHPNGDLYDIYLEDANSNSYIICANISTNSQNRTDPDPDCDISAVPPGLYDLYSTVAGSSNPRLSTATQQVEVYASGNPQIVVKGGNIWAANETTEISLLFHMVFADGPFDVKLYDGAGDFVQDIAIDHSGISFEAISWTVPDLKALGLTLCDLSSGKTCTIKSYKADGSLAAEVAVNINQPKIVLSNGLGPYAQGEAIYIYLKAHTPGKRYDINIQNAISPSISALFTTLDTNAVGDTTNPIGWIVPADCGPQSGWPDGLYEITSHPLGLPPQLAILEDVEINTPTTPYITIAGGYVWAAGSLIQIRVHKHVQNSHHYLEFDGVRIPTGPTGDTFLTDGCGSASLVYVIPAATSPGIHSITSFLESSQAQVATREVTVSGQPMIQVLEGDTVLPYQIITIRLTDHRPNFDYRVIYANKELFTVLTDSQGQAEVKYDLTHLPTWPPPDLTDPDNYGIPFDLHSETTVVPILTAAQTTLTLQLIDLDQLIYLPLILHND